MRMMKVNIERVKHIEKAHVHRESGKHHGLEKTMENLMDLFNENWRQLHKDVQDYIKNCSLCHLEQKQDEATTAATQPWSQVAIEVLGPFSKTESGMEYVAILVDCSTLWIEGIAMKSKDENRLSTFIFDTFMRMGFCPFYLVGAERTFIQKVQERLKTMCADFDEFLDWFLEQSKDVNFERKSKKTVKAVAPCAKGVLMRNESTNGMNLVLGEAVTERFEGCVSLIGKLASRSSTWDEELNRALFALNCRFDKDGKDSPFYSLMHRDSSCLSIDRNTNSSSQKKIGDKENEMSDTEKIRKISENGNKGYTISPKDSDRTTYKRNSRVSAHKLRKISKTNDSQELMDGCTIVSAMQHTEQMNCNNANGHSSNGTSNRNVEETIENGECHEVAHPKEIHLTILAEDKDCNEEDETKISAIENSDCISSKRLKSNKGRKFAKELPYKCPRCPATYLATEEELNFHLECHIKDEKLLKCPKCPKTVKNWSHLQRHLLSHEDLAHWVRTIPENKRKCSFCGKVFTTRDGMMRHEQVLHKGYSRFECHICKVTYKESKTFKRHMDLHANIIYKCEHCKYKSKVLRNLLEHSRIHEGRGFSCSVCKKVFTKQSILNTHMQIHNSSRNAFICDQCGMKLANLSSLRQHIRNVHLEPSYFSCEYCSYVGKSKSNLLSHTERTHNKPFKCDSCSYCSKSDSALKRHVDIFHNEVERQFACSSCPYRARDPKHLAEHMRFLHNPNALRFSCPFCSMKFKTMTLLRHHLPAHTGQHLYSCQICGYSAKYRQTLHHHVKAKHPGEQTSGVIKGTPCSEIPCLVADDDSKGELEDQIVGTVEEENCEEFVEEVIVTDDRETSLFVAKLLTDQNTVTVDDHSEKEDLMDGSTISIAAGDTVQLHIITDEEERKDVEDVVPMEEQTSKAVEVLLLAMNPHQVITESVAEELVETAE